MKNAVVRHISLLFLAIFIVAITAAFTPDAAQTSGTERSRNSELAGGWHFVRTPNPRGGADAISIMRTADTSRSDPDLAGLMIRCRDGGTEALIVLIRAFRIGARPHVDFGKSGIESQLVATVAAPGTAILLPGDATTLINGPWHARSELSIRVEDGPTTIRGVVKIAGLQAAVKVLQASCSTQLSPPI